MCLTSWRRLRLCGEHQTLERPATTKIYDDTSPTALLSQIDVCQSVVGKFYAQAVSVKESATCLRLQETIRVQMSSVAKS